MATSDVALDSATGLADAGTVSVTIHTAHADELDVLVDDNAGGTPATYNLDVEVDIDGTGTWMPRDALTSLTAYHHDYSALGYAVRVTLTNNSGGAADFRLRVESHN